MPHINEMTQPSKKFLNKDDVGKGALLTIRGVEQRNVAKEGDAPEVKWLLLFHEASKPFVLNSTNIQLAARACHSDMTEEWVGKKVVLYFDPNVSYQGKLIGGIRIRAPKPQALAPVQVQKQAIAAAAAKWTQSHAMAAPALSQDDADAMVTEDEIPF